MAKLNYLMAQNYLRLGITYDCDELLEKAKTKLRKALKLEDIDERNFNEKDKKLFYGNSITIECLKI